MALDRNFDLADVDGQGHVVRRTSFQASGDRFTNILQRFGFRLPLRDASWNRGAFGDDNAGLIAFKRDQQLHTWIIAEAVLRQVQKTKIP